MDDQIRSLHRQIKGLQLAVLSMAAIGIAFLLSGAGSPVQDVVRTRGVEVINEQGRVVVSLRSDGLDGGWIMVASAADRRKVILDSSPSLIVTDKLGGESVRLEVDVRGLASFHLRTSNE